MYRYVVPKKQAYGYIGGGRTGCYVLVCPRLLSPLVLLLALYVIAL